MSERKSCRPKGGDPLMRPRKNLISRNAMISLTAMMFLILLLFQVSASSVGFFQGEKNQQITNERRLTKSDETKEEERYLRFQKKTTYLLSERNGDIPAAAMEGVTVLKEPYEIVTSLEQVLEKANSVERLILYRKQLSDGEVEILEQLTEERIDLIFAILPENYKSSPLLLKLLGIEETKEKKINTDGMRVLEDFMLGGRSDYKKLSVHNIPWISLKGSTKTFMCGLFKNYEEDGMKNEELPPLAWRNRCNSAYIFVFNGDFMEDKSNFGMFISALSNMEDLFLYPAINARTLIVDNFPYLTSENNEEMQGLYSMTARRFLEDNILPDLVAITEKTGDVMSALANVSFDKEKEIGNEMSQDTLKSFQNTLLKQSGELGIGFYDKNSVSEKVDSNLDYFKNHTSLKFPFFSGIGLSLQDILKVKQEIKEAGTVIQNWEEMQGETFQFLDEDLISVPVTSTGYAYTNVENLKLKNAISGIGISNHKIDIKEVVYPEKAKDNWRYQSVELGKNLDTYWMPYQAFDTVSLAEEGKRVRQYLIMDYVYNKTNSGDEVQIVIENLHTEVYFLFRTNRELDQVEGGTFQEVEEGIYLLTIQQEQAKLILKDVKNRE